jgi:hypothetical protein
MVSNAKLMSSWQFEIAALLSQIGCIAMPHSLLIKAQDGKPLNKYEGNLYQSHPVIGYRLLKEIYRMEAIAEMIKDQNRCYDHYDQQAAISQGQREIQMGSQILHVAIDYDRIIINGSDHSRAVALLQDRVDEYNPKLVKALGNAEIILNNWPERLVEVGGIEAGMILKENLLGLDGEIIANRHQEVTQSVLERIRLFSKEFLAGESKPKMVMVYLPHVSRKSFLPHRGGEN